VVVNDEGVTEVTTYLNETELVRFKDAGRLTTDEVLDMHNFLQKL